GPAPPVRDPGSLNAGISSAASGAADNGGGRRGLFYTWAERYSGSRLPDGGAEFVPVVQVPPHGCESRNGVLEELKMQDRSMARRRFIGGLAAAQVAVSPARAAATGPAKWKLVVGCDHAGFPLKGTVIETLQSWGHTVKDIGTYSTSLVDFPDIA